MSGDQRDDIDWQRLDRYVRGVLSPAERGAVEAWVNASAERAALVDAMRTVGRAGSRPLRFDAQRALQRFKLVATRG